MRDRRRIAAFGAKIFGRKIQRAFLQRPIAPHRRAPRLAAAFDFDGGGQFEHPPKIADPRPRRDDDLPAFDRPFVGRDGLDRGRRGFAREAANRRAADDFHAQRAGFGGEPPHRGEVVGEAAALFVQDRIDSRRPPIAENRFHISVGFLAAADESRFVSDGALLAVDFFDSGAHRGGRNLQIADAVVGKSRRIGFPHGDAVRHQFAHRRLKIIVAHHAASDSARAGAGAGFVDDHDIIAAPARRGETPRRR